MNLLLLVCALLCELIAALTGFHLLHASNVLGWVALGLCFWIASLIVGPTIAWRRE